MILPHQYIELFILTTHLFRQVDVVEELRKRLPATISINPYDIFAVRKMYALDKQEKYFFKPKFGSPQYSAEFVGWIEVKCKENPQFFIETRKQVRRAKRLTKRPPD